MCLSSMLSLILLLGVTGAISARTSGSLHIHSAVPDRSKVAASDRIDGIPYYEGTAKSQHSAGYVTVDEGSQRRLFWYFVESQRQPEDDPLVLWLNGGPGCSSFDGFVYEQGPFKFNLDASGHLTLTDNPHTWDKVANMLYLDSPAGVGLSYSQNKGDYHTNDTQTAIDAERFLRLWLKDHPKFLSNRFFVSGESYAGVYVPNLAHAVVAGNKAGHKPKINIEGYLVGNGVTDEQFDGDALPRFAAGKSLITHAQYDHLNQACDGSFVNVKPGSKCNDLVDKLYDEVSKLNVYDILETCYHDHNTSSISTSASPSSTARAGGASGDGIDSAAARRSALLSLRHNHRTWPVRGGLPSIGSVVQNWAHLLATQPPCVDTRAADLWLNDAAVRLALHAEPVSSIGRWEICSSKISYVHDAGSMIPVHKKLIKHHGLRALVYSGDHDMAVPHTGSEAWTSSLGYDVQHKWQPWIIDDDQVGGYAVVYAPGLTYLTVKGAGHMVPLTHPAPALAMFSRFIANQSVYADGGKEQPAS